MKKKRQHEITQAFLMKYQAAAVKNATELLQDGLILLEKKRYARAYFLGVVSIEETGKAWLAFSARGRNLSDEGLKHKLKQLFEDHSQKITAAFACWITAVSDKKAAADRAVKLILNLKHGRELSMYVDASDLSDVLEPSNVVRPIAATHSLKLAGGCLQHTVAHFASNAPPKFSSFDDKFTCLNSERLMKMISDENFGQYLLDQITQQGSDFNFSKVVVTYHDAYFCKGKKFDRQE